MIADVALIGTYLGRPLTSAELAQVEAWAKVVEARILARIPDLQERIDAGTLSLEVVQQVIADVVIRRLHNPEGKVSERIDDYSYTLSATARHADLWLTEAEWGLLLPDAMSGAFSIRPSFESGRGRRWFCP